MKTAFDNRALYIVGAKVCNCLPESIRSHAYAARFHRSLRPLLATANCCNWGTAAQGSICEISGSGVGF